MKLLVGYGNTMRQDDGVGWQIAAQLAPHYTNTAVQVIQTHQLMPEIAATIATVSGVVFVDAELGTSPGKIQVKALTPASTAGDTHSLGPAEMLYIAQTLYNACPPAHLVTITGQAFDFGDSLSDPVRDAIPEAIAQIKRLLE
jgi:hydrogenase maturation protease